MRRPIVECVPNFSEGRDPAIIDRIVDAITEGTGIAVLGRTMDPDHNRSVITFAGTPESVIAAAVRAVSAAVQCIDLNRHAGIHPRLGAADVVPFVPVSGLSLEDCAGIAHEAGALIWRELGVPVYFYEAAALRPGRTRLENVRRGGFEILREAALDDPERRPDIGGPALHPTAGACIVGARKYLIAFNMNLRTEDTSIAVRIARRIRESSGGMRHVKALGLALESRQQSQVSMNLSDFEQTPLHTVVEAVRAEAVREGVEIAGTEIIGLLPKAALENAAEFYMTFENFRPDLVLENRLAEVLPTPLGDPLAEISDPVRNSGAGSAAALAGSLASGLGILVCRMIHRDPAVYTEHQNIFSAAERVADNAESALSIAERAASLQADLSVLRAECLPEYVPYTVTAAGLADAALRGGIATARLHLQRVGDAESRKSLEKRLQKVE
jgi:glutamate formiminotransferase